MVEKELESKKSIESGADPDELRKLRDLEQVVEQALRELRDIEQVVALIIKYGADSDKWPVMTRDLDLDEAAIKLRDLEHALIKLRDLEQALRELRDLGQYYYLEPH